MYHSAQNSRASNRSGMTRTPGADSQFSLNEDRAADADGTNETFEEDTQNETSQSRASSQRSQSRVSGTGTVTGNTTGSESPNVTQSRSGSRSSVTTINLPPIDQETSGNAWQAGKTVTQANEYMLKYEILTDITFLVGENKEEITAHKYMLMLRSPVLFKALSKQTGNAHLRIAVPDIKPETFRELLQYMYTDQFDIHHNNVAEMLHAAKKFQLTGLKKLCFQFLDSEMNDEIVTKIMEQAHIYNETVFYEKCKRYIFMNGNSVLRKPQFAELCRECVCHLLKSDELRAEEEAVFEACITWASAECRRQKKQPTDHSRRQVLGKILYLIRFPLMSVTYFTQKVSLSQLLSHDETLSIFQYFHGEEQQLPNRFSRNERVTAPRGFMDNDDPVIQSAVMTPSVVRVRRFPKSGGPWKQNGPPDAISFKASQPIVLYGVEIYGVHQGQETYSLKLLVYDDISRDEIRKNESSVFTSTMKDKYEVYLSRPVRVPPRRLFTVLVGIRGAATRKGTDGETVVIVDGVTFEFSESSRSSNGTGVSIGQIPGLLFNKSQ